MLIFIISDCVVDRRITQNFPISSTFAFFSTLNVGTFPFKLFPNRPMIYESPSKHDNYENYESPSKHDNYEFRPQNPIRGRVKDTYFNLKVRT